MQIDTRQRTIAIVAGLAVLALGVSLAAADHGGANIAVVYDDIGDSTFDLPSPVEEADTGDDDPGGSDDDNQHCNQGRGDGAALVAR